MSKQISVYSEPYEVGGTYFDIEVFRSVFGRTFGQWGYRAVWTREPDGLKGEGGLSGTIQGAVINARIQASQNRTIYTQRHK